MNERLSDHSGSVLWRDAPAVRREYERGLRNGWIGAAAFYAVFTTLIVLAFAALGVHP